MEGRNLERICWLDYVRALAICLVVLSHIASAGVNLFDVRSLEWQFSNALQGGVYICVPLLVMVSGTLFMSKDRNIVPHIVNVVIHLLAWSFIYAIYDSRENLTITNILGSALNGHYHLWFLNMIIGIYLIYPFLKTWVDKQRLILYFIILWLVFVNIGYLTSILPVYSMIDKIQMNFVMGYTAFFLLGYYLDRFVPEHSMSKVVLCVEIILGYAITTLGTTFLSLDRGEFSAMLYGYFTPNIILFSIGVFLAIKEMNSKLSNYKVSKIITEFSRDSFGIYLVHDFLIMFLARMNFTVYSYSPFFQIPGAFIFVILMSWGIVRILKKIPVLGRILV